MRANGLSKVRLTEEAKRVQHDGSGGKMAPCLLFSSQILSGLWGLRQAGRRDSVKQEGLPHGGGKSAPRDRRQIEIC